MIEYRKVRLIRVYELRIGDRKFTIPKENIRYLAMVRAKDFSDDVDLRTADKAIKYLKSIGIEVWERK